MKMNNLLKTMCLAGAVCACGMAYGQEEVSAITPLKITSGLNADVIAEAKASDSNYSTEDGYYINPRATMVDGDSGRGGRNAFYTTDVEEKGAIKYKTVDGNTYLDGNTDSVPYHLEDAAANNALLIKGTDTGQYTLSLSTLDSSDMPVASTLYLLATSAEGSSTLSVTIIGENDDKIGTTTVTVGDWWSEHTSEKLTQVYETYRITVKGAKPNNSWDGTQQSHINYVNKGSGNNGSFYLQRIAVSTLSNQKVKEIRIQKESSGSNVVILAATAVTEEVTEKDKQTNLDYLVNTTTSQRIAETVKARVNLLRDFKQDAWQPLVLNYELTAGQAKKMFGENISLSRITDQSYIGNRIIFYPVIKEGKLQDDMKETDIAIQKGEYYLIKLPALSDVKDETTGLQKYSCDYVQFRAVEDYSTGLSEEKSVKNSDGSTATFHGTYVSGKSIGEGSYAVSGGKFYKYTDNPTIGAFRFWMTISGGSEAKEISLDFADGSGTDSIVLTDGGAEAGGQSGTVYSIDGRIVRRGADSCEGLAKGLYIVNGKKVSVK